MKEHFLEESQGHIVSFSEYGNSDGPTILSFHGGPGAKSRARHAECFDLSKYRVVLFDQRGCGKSTPLGELQNNTTENILKDAERIRESLHIENWFLSGGSWGSTLSLLYAIAYPERVRGILLTAVFLADRDSISWSMEDPKGLARMFPDVWRRRLEFFKRFNINIESQNEDMLRLLQDGSTEEQKEVTAGMENWERNLFSVQLPMSFKDPQDVTDADIASAKIFAHYEMNHEFIAENYILENLNKIADVPTIIVHGRYDILCPLEKAYKLKEGLKNSELVIATSSGHKLTAEGETIQRMAFDRFLERNCASI